MSQAARCSVSRRPRMLPAWWSSCWGRVQASSPASSCRSMAASSSTEAEMSDASLPSENRYIVPALAQGLGILSLFGGENRSFTAPEIAKRLSLPRTKVFRLLQTLQAMDYVRCGEDKRHFTLGPALLRGGFEYLASLDMDDKELAALFRDQPLQRFTSQTPTTLKALKTLLAEDRKRGYAVSQAFFEAGVSSIAAPVRDGAGRIVAAINVTAVNAHIDEQAMHGELKDAVLEAAAKISCWLCRSATAEAPVAPA